MGIEIEHKYLVVGESYRTMATSQRHIRQGYLQRDPERTVRIRISDNQGFITIKGISSGDFRHEYEYEIPVADAEELLSMCTPPIIDKVRWIVPFGGFKWEVDEFSSPRKITMAEIELPHSDTSYPLPSFLGDNVTGDPRYYNSNL